MQTRIWSSRGMGTESVVVLTADSLYCARVLPDQVEWLRDHVAAGGRAIDLPIEDAIDIPIPELRGVCYEEDGSDLVLTDSHGRRQVVPCGGQPMRDDVFAGLLAFLGHTFRHSKTRQSAWVAAKQSLGVAAVVIVAMALLCYVALRWEAGTLTGRWSGKSALLVWLAWQLGPSGIAAVGGLILLGVMLQMARQIARRSPVVVLERIQTFGQVSSC